MVGTPADDLGAAFSSGLSSVSIDFPLLYTVCRRDVTDVFEAFHRDPRHRRKLEAFRVGTLVGYEPSALVKDFRALKEEITAEGLFEVMANCSCSYSSVVRSPFSAL